MPVSRIEHVFCSAVTVGRAPDRWSWLTRHSDDAWSENDDSCRRRKGDPVVFVNSLRAAVSAAIADRSARQEDVASAKQAVSRG
jgi:hypothetical protein